MFFGVNDALNTEASAQCGFALAYMCVLFTDIRFNVFEQMMHIMN